MTIAVRLSMIALLSVVALQFANVMARHSLGISLPWLAEGAVYAHGAIFMLGAGWTSLKARHVAIDLVSHSISVKRRKRLALLGGLLFALPFAVGIFALSLPYVAQSWKTLESSSAVGGLPGLFLIKTLIPVFAILLLLAFLASLLVREKA